MLRSLSPLALILIVLCTACSNHPKDDSETAAVQLDSIPVPQDQHPQIKNPYSATDKSPMDMAYFPTDYPQLKMSDSITKPPVMRVIYSRPHRDGRKIFGKLLPDGQPWRLGANEATELQVFQPVTVEGNKVQPGRYILYCIPDSSEWTIVFNKNIDTWGLHIDSTKDFLRIKTSANRTQYSIEDFTIAFQPISGGAEMIMAWDDEEARLPFQFQY